jgi:hypothetical protein
MDQRMIVSGPFPITTLFPNFVFPDGIDAAYSFNGQAWFVKGNKYTGISFPTSSPQMDGSTSFDINGHWGHLAISSSSLDLV